MDGTSETVMAKPLGIAASSPNDTPATNADCSCCIVFPEMQPKCRSDAKREDKLIPPTDTLDLKL